MDWGNKIMTFCLLLPGYDNDALKVFLFDLLDHLSIFRNDLKSSLHGKLLHVIVMGPFSEKVQNNCKVMILPFS